MLYQLLLHHLLLAWFGKDDAQVEVGGGEGEWGFGLLHHRVQLLTQLYTIFDKSYQYSSCIPSIDRWYPFHFHVPGFTMLYPF